MLTSAEQAALKSVHGPNLYITLLTGVAMLVAGLGSQASAATIISFGVMVGSLIWSNAKLSTSTTAVLHSGNFWTVVVTAVAYVVSRLLGVTLPSGVVPGIAALITTFVVGNTVRQPATAAAASSASAATTTTTTTTGG